MSVIFDRRARVIALAVVLIVIGALGTIVSASLERCPTGCPPVNAGARSQGRKPGHLRCRGAQSNEGLSEHHRRHCDSTGRYLRHRHGHRHFDEPISDRAAAQRRLSVRTSPSVPGSWYWLDDQHAHWRPQHYFRPGTVVTAEANIYGTPLGNGSTDKKTAGPRSPSATPTYPSPTTSPNKSASMTTVRWSAPCPPRWGWAAAKPLAGRPSRFGPSAGSTR
jgi:hypothetical protein